MSWRRAALLLALAAGQLLASLAWEAAGRREESERRGERLLRGLERLVPRTQPGPALERLGRRLLRGCRGVPCGEAAQRVADLRRDAGIPRRLFTIFLFDGAGRAVYGPPGLGRNAEVLLR